MVLVLTVMAIAMLLMKVMPTMMMKKEKLMMVMIRW